MNALTDSPIIAINRNGQTEPYARLIVFEEPGAASINVYKDAALQSTHPSPIRADSSGVFPGNIYLPEGYYRYGYQVLGAGGELLREVRDLDAPSGATAPTSDSEDIVSVNTTPYTLAASDYGKLVNALPSGSDIALQLLDAGDVQDQEVTIRHGGSDSFITITPTGADVINGRSGLFLRPGGVVKLKSNGFDYYKLFDLEGRLPSVIVAKSIGDTNLPTSPAAGDLYVAPSSSPPTGWTANYVHVYDGVSDWLSFAPYEGQTALVLDETVNGRPKEYTYFNSAWVVKGVSLKTAAFSAQQSSGTAASATAASSWNPVFLNETRYNDIPGLSLVGGFLDFQSATTCAFKATIASFETGFSRAGISNVDDTSTRILGVGKKFPATTDDHSGDVSVEGVIQVDTAGDQWKLEIYSELVGAIGSPGSVSSESEIYATIELREISLVS